MVDIGRADAGINSESDVNFKTLFNIEELWINGFDNLVSMILPFAYILPLAKVEED